MLDCLSGAEGSIPSWTATNILMYSEMLLFNLPEGKIVLRHEVFRRSMPARQLEGVGSNPTVSAKNIIKKMKTIMINNKIMLKVNTSITNF
jgi:hypothetical protein